MISNSTSFGRISQHSADDSFRLSRSNMQRSVSRGGSMLSSSKHGAKGRSEKLLTQVAAIRQRNKQRKSIETLFCVSSLCCAVLFTARFRHDQWVSTYSNYAVFPAFIVSLVLSLVWLIQLIQIYNQPALKISPQEKSLASIADNEDGFELVGTDDTQDESKSQQKFDSIDFSKTMSSLMSSRSANSEPSNRSILLVKPLDRSGQSLESSSIVMGRLSQSMNKSFDSRTGHSRSHNEDLSHCTYFPGVANPPSMSPNTSITNVNIFQKYDIGRAVASLWRENLRKWVCKNLLSPITEEIDSLNKVLSPTRLKIGVDSVERLKSTASSLSPIDDAKIKKLLPYLEVSSNQGYVVKRIKELSQYCLSAYKWNSGGAYEGKTWTELFPTDCDLVFHLFCTFMDSLYPANALHLNGRYFLEYFTRGVVSTSKSINEPVMICKYSSSPSAFKLIVDGEEVSVEEGQYNMFDAIIGLLYVVDKSHDGNLGSINLRYTGLGLLRIVSGH